MILQHTFVLKTWKLANGRRTDAIPYEQEHHVDAAMQCAIIYERILEENIDSS
jgi:hypothetical protein